MYKFFLVKVSSTLDKYVCIVVRNFVLFTLWPYFTKFALFIRLPSVNEHNLLHQYAKRSIHKSFPLLLYPDPQFWTQRPGTKGPDQQKG